MAALLKTNRGLSTPTPYLFTPTFICKASYITSAIEKGDTWGYRGDSGT